MLWPGTTGGWQRNARRFSRKVQEGNKGGDDGGGGRLYSKKRGGGETIVAEVQVKYEIKEKCGKEPNKRRGTRREPNSGRGIIREPNSRSARRN